MRKSRTNGQNSLGGGNPIHSGAPEPRKNVLPGSARGESLEDYFEPTLLEYCRSRFPREACHLGSGAWPSHGVRSYAQVEQSRILPNLAELPVRAIPTE